MDPQVREVQYRGCTSVMLQFKPPYTAPLESSQHCSWRLSQPTITWSMRALGGSLGIARGRAPGRRPLFVARQPIVDRRGALVAYELLYRGLTDLRHADFADGARATAQLINEGIGVGSLAGLVGDVLAFVNFDRTLLVSGAALSLHPPERFVIEVLEDVDPDPEVLGMLQQIRAHGLSVALDDVTTQPRIAAFAPYVDWVKLDVRAASDDALDGLIAAVRSYGARTLAEKVESVAETRSLHERGVDYFQGYFVGRPQTIGRPQLPSLSAPLARFVRATMGGTVNFAEVAEAVAGDPALSYRLLTLANSASALPTHPITSVRAAVVRAGELQLKRMAALLAFAPPATTEGVKVGLTATLLRATFAESIGVAAFGEPAFDCFIAGLLSGLDEYLGVDVDASLLQLGGDSQLVANVGATGRTSAIVDVVRSYVAGEWSSVEASASALGLAIDDLPRLYVRALQSGDQLGQAAA